MIFIGILDFLGVRGFLLRNSRIPSDFCLGILEFLTRNSRIPYYVIYYVILGLDPRISIL